MGGALNLAAGNSEAIILRGTSDGKGFWRLPPGRYRVAAIYEVPDGLAPTSNTAPAGVVWRGRLESPKASVSVAEAD
jgi:hypothetical protein